MMYNINVELQISQTKQQSIINKMVKTRNQNQQSENLQRGVTTRSGFELKKSNTEVEVVTDIGTEIVVLPAMKMSKEMKRRANVRKEIAKKSWKKQTDKKCRRFERVERDFLKHVYHNAGEMTAIWKNFEMAFRDIDKLLMFKKRVEGNSIVII
jgi:hypothetical protein